MVELQGSLAWVGLPALTRFMTDLSASGLLAVTHERWTGSVWFERGVVISATFGAERGQPALDAVTLLLRAGQFAFTDEAPPATHDVELSSEALLAHLDRLASDTTAWDALLAADWQVVPPDQWGVEAPPDDVTLGRDMLRALLAVCAGGRRAEDMAAPVGLVETLRALDQLRVIGLVRGPTTAPDAAIPPESPEQPAVEPDTATLTPESAPSHAELPPDTEPEPVPAAEAEWTAAALDDVDVPLSTIDLDGDTVETFLAVKDGKRTVADIAGKRGLAETINALERLRAVGLVRAERPIVSASAPSPVSD